MPGIRMQLVSLLVLELNQSKAGWGEGLHRQPKLKRADEKGDEKKD